MQQQTALFKCHSPVPLTHQQLPSTPPHPPFLFSWEPAPFLLGCSLYLDLLPPLKCMQCRISFLLRKIHLLWNTYSPLRLASHHLG